MTNLSIIIPSRSDEFLQKTIDDLLAKAEGDIEIVVVLDGYWPDTPIKENTKVIVLHHGSKHNSVGMRDSINSGVAISSGKYIMKIDEHCMVDQGYDVKLSKDCKDNWVVIPRRYRLDAENWKVLEDGRPPVDHMFIAYPYERPNDKTCGLHGDIWKEKQANSKEDIEDLMTFQGSCYFMSRKHWDWLGGLDSKEYGPFTQEAQEIGNKTWLGGGRMIVNKKTWYAHYHKGTKGKGYGFSNAQYDAHMRGTEKGRLFCIDHWVNNKWDKRIHDWKWLIEKFWPVPTWPINWEERLLIDKEQAYVGANISKNDN